jgi:hypothetical protein
MANPTATTPHAVAADETTPTLQQWIDALNDLVAQLASATATRIEELLESVGDMHDELNSEPQDIFDQDNLSDAQVLHALNNIIESLQNAATLIANAHDDCGFLLRTR